MPVLFEVMSLGQHVFLNTALVSRCRSLRCLLYMWETRHNSHSLHYLWMYFLLACSSCTLLHSHQAPSCVTGVPAGQYLPGLLHQVLSLPALTHSAALMCLIGTHITAHLLLLKEACVAPAGQDSQPEWAHSAAGHSPGPPGLQPPHRHLSAAVSCIGRFGAKPAPCGQCAGADLAAPPHHSCTLPLLPGEHLLHHLPARRSALQLFGSVFLALWLLA